MIVLEQTDLPETGVVTLVRYAAAATGPLDGLILGGRLAGQLGASLSVCGLPLRVDGRLGKTGVGPFDESYFVSFQTLAAIVSFCSSAAVFD